MSNQDLIPEKQQRDTQARSSGDTVRDILALVTVIGFVLITAILAVVFPMFALGSTEKMIDYLRDLSSIYSGIVGLIIGYYFGKP